MDTNEFHDWLKTAPPGSCAVYWRGDLACEAQFNQDLHAVRAMAWRAMEADRLRLTQRRHPDIPFTGHGRGGATYEYIATMRSPANPNDDRPIEARGHRVA